MASLIGQTVLLGGSRGVVVQEGVTVSGMVVFPLASGEVVARVYQARNPDVWLDEVCVGLVAETGNDDGPTPLAPSRQRATATAGPASLRSCGPSGETASATATAGFTGRFALLVDDAYWGRRVQPGAFVAAPLGEDIVMGYRLSGSIRREGAPLAGEPVSLEVRLQTAEDGVVVLWDSEEYNRLAWSDTAGTFVAGPEVAAPIMTDANGNWEYIVPCGDGAVYQRAGE
jgi:hypothetical protein